MLSTTDPLQEIYQKFEKKIDLYIAPYQPALHETIRSFLNPLTRSRVARQPPPGDDSTAIGNAFNNMRRDSLSWAKTWARRDLPDLTHSEEQLLDFTVLEEGSIPEARLKAMGKLAPIRVLSAMLGRALCKEVLEEPFLALRRFLKPVKPDMAALIEDFYSRLSPRKIFLSPRSLSLYSSDIVLLLISVVDHVAAQTFRCFILDFIDRTMTTRLQTRRPLRAARNMLPS